MKSLSGLGPQPYCTRRNVVAGYWQLMCPYTEKDSVDLGRLRSLQRAFLALEILKV